jgi:DNA-binding CsgD family transcriptional regulator
MIFYSEYFKKEINYITSGILFLSIVVVTIDNFLNGGLYPYWITYYNYGLIFISGILLSLVYFKKASSKKALIFFVYIFTLNIYLPGFTDDENLRILILTSFSNLGACLSLILILGILGGGVHILILGVFNILLMLSLYYCQITTTTTKFIFDFINLVIFFISSIIIYFSFREINRAFNKNERIKENIQKQKTELLTIKNEEEKKINSILSINRKESFFLINNIVRRIEKEQQELIEIRINVANAGFATKKGSISSSIEQIDKLAEGLLKIKQYCLIKKYQIFNQENINYVDERNDLLVAKLKNMNKSFTQKELKICELIYLNFSSKEIADKLNISKETIKWYRKRIRKKLNLKRGEKLFLRLNKIILEIS